MKRHQQLIQRTLAAVLVAAMAVPTVSSAAAAVQSGQVAQVTADATKEKELRLWYDEPAPDSDEGWENWSIPLGGGYMGANVFGGTDTERIQITENSLANPYPEGMNNFAEVYIDFGHKDVSNYSRDLILNNSTSHVQYDCNGTTYTREYFTSYPDKVMVMKFTSSKEGELSFTLRPTIPYLKDYGTTPGDGKGKTGTVTAQGDTITLSGNMNYYDIDFEGQLRLIPEGGSMQANEDGTITLTGATSAVVLMAVGTNYQLESRVFTENDRTKKLAPYDHPHEKVTSYLNEASSKSYEELLSNHISDYREFFARARVDLGGVEPSYTTDELLSRYKEGEYNPYLEELYFQFGRYLLISSSRKGTLPGNLQGIWNVHDSAPWSAGYWHNINIQMNYWPAFNTNLAELFESYADLNKAFRGAAEKNADNYLKQINAENIAEAGTGENGWAVGTGVSPYTVEAPKPDGHSGPGTGGLTSKLFWDYYDFTRSEDVLRDTTYPTLLSMDKFLTKVVKPIDGKLLASPSASPEQCINGVYPNYYHTDGCLFDQQMIYENHRDTIKAAELLGIQDEPTVDVSRDQLDQLDPVLVGWSGQVKEYREENYYGEIGEYKHRHISQLVGLYPGQTINSTTPAWLDAAKVTLTERGDESTGWAMAHRLNLWARAQDGDHAYLIFQNLLKKGTLNNLWDSHPPFQIDGNYGGTAGVAEMLLQSHEGFIAPLAARPEAWATGSYRGLTARGNFEVGADWSDGQADKFEIVSKSGGECKVKYYNIADAELRDSEGNPVEFTAQGSDLITFDTQEGMTYTITDIPEYQEVAAPSGLTLDYQADGSVSFEWNESADAVSYNLYCAQESQPDYQLVASDLQGNSYLYRPENLNELGQCTFKLVAVGENGRESQGSTTMMLPVEQPENPTGYFIDDTTLQISFEPGDQIDCYNYYQKIEDGYQLIASSKYSVFCLENASKDSQFAVSAVANGRESQKTDITVVSEYELENVLKGQKISLTSGGRWVHDLYPLSNGVDGDLSTRYAVGDAAGPYSIEIDMGREHPLNELNIYEFKPGEDTTRSFETKIEVYQNGEWTTVIDKQPLNGGQSTFDLGGIVGSKIQITFNNTKHATSASIYEITCSSILQKPGDKRELLSTVTQADEIDTKAYFEASVESFQQAKAEAESVLIDAAANQASIDQSLENLKAAMENLESNLLYQKPITANPIRDGEEFVPEKMVDGDESTRFAAYDDGRDVEVIVDLGGVHTLDQLYVIEFLDGTGLTRGGETTISLLQGEEWKTMVDHQSLTASGTSKATTVFDMNGEQASKIKYQFHNTRTDQRISIYELQATGEKAAALPVITGINPLETLTVENGTSFAELNLPQTVTVTLDNGETKALPVVWSDQGYNPTVAGDYTLTGVLTLDGTVTNPNNLTASITITVKEADAQNANKTSLKFYLDKANAVDQEVIDSLVESAQAKFTAALENGQKVYDDAAATQEEVDAAAKELRIALNMLSMEAGDKEALNELIAEAEDLIANAGTDYPQSAVDQLQKAIDLAKEVVEDGDAFQADVDKAYNDLLDAIEAFQNSKLDWRALEAAVADAANVAADKDNYVNDETAWEAFDEAYVAAQNMLESKTAADQTAIDTATTALLEASSNLRYKADKDTLNKVITDAETVDVTLYTASSVAMFRSALAAANTVLADESLSVDDQAVVDNAATALEEAMAALMPVDQVIAGGGDNTTGSNDTAVAGGGEEPTSNDSITATKTGDINSLPIALAVIVLAASLGFVFRKKEDESFF